MTPFQWLAAGLLGLLIVFELYLQRTHQTRLRLSLLRLLIWVAGLLLITFPDTSSWLAQQLRIGRGVDVVLYSAILIFPVAFFYLLHTQEQQRQQITRIVRELALQSPLEKRQEDLPPHERPTRVD